MTIDYKQITKDLLKEYVRVRDSMHDNLERLERLETTATNITTAYGREGVQSSPKAPDEKLLNLLAEIDLLKRNIGDNKILIDEVENSMKNLTDMEKDITVTLYGEPYRNHKLANLMQTYCYEKTAIYNIANKSITKMSYILYGKG